jgi:hypothetical protein
MLDPAMMTKSRWRLLPLLAVVVGIAAPATTAEAANPTKGRFSQCSVYLRGGGGMVTFSTYVIPAPAGSPGHGVPPPDCKAEAEDLTSHHVGSPFLHNVWTTTAQRAQRQLVCLFHVAWFGSAMTVKVRDYSSTVIGGDACQYLIAHA